MGLSLLSLLVVVVVVIAAFTQFDRRNHGTLFRIDEKVRRLIAILELSN